VASRDDRQRTVAPVGPARHHLQARNTYSPDPDYQEKRDYIQGQLERTRQEPERYAFLYQDECFVPGRVLCTRTSALYQDECGYYRKPSLAKGYEVKGASQQPRARLGHAERTRHRVVGCLDALTGQVQFRQGPKIDTNQLTRLYQQVAKAYPEVETIYLVQDTIWYKTTGRCTSTPISSGSWRRKGGPGRLTCPSTGRICPRSRSPVIRFRSNCCVCRPMPRG